MTSLLQGDHQSGLTLPKPPDSARPVGLQNNIRRRSQLVTGPYPTHDGRSRGQPVQTAKPGTSESNIPANWDVMTGQQTRGAQVSNAPFLSTFLQSTAGGTIVGGGPKQKKHKQTIHRFGGKPRSPVASGPAASYGKSTEEMYDEIIHLKKILHVTIAERDVYRGKVLRFEKEVLKKDKQIEDLLAAGHVPSRDMTRSLVEKKSSLSSTISSLRQQIHSYEAQLKEKEKIIAAMAQDLRSTAMQELEIQANTYYAEIVRLQKIVEKQAAALQSYTPRTVREGEVRTKALSDAVKNLSDELLEVTQAKADLEKEVEQLRKRVGSIPSATHRETGERGQLADKYADLKKDEMIGGLVDLEMTLKERNKQIEDLEANMKTEQESYQKQIDCVIDEAAGLKEKAQSLEEKLAEDDAYRHKLRKIIKQLKEDRNHYRSLAEQTKGELEGVRREVTSQTEQTVCLQEKLDTAQESLSNEERARKHAQELAKRKANIFMQDKKKLDKAAEIVQNAWKRWRSWKRQRKYEKEMDSIVEDLQAALRGHVARQYFLKDSSSVRGKDNIEHSNIDDDDEEEEEAIETIQSVFRGHLSRTVVVRS